MQLRNCVVGGHRARSIMSGTASPNGPASSITRRRNNSSADANTDGAALQRQQSFDQARAKFERQRTLAQVLDLPDGELRGVSMPDLLAYGAWLYSNNGAAARAQPVKVFALSHPVRRIDFFISHAWRSPRATKCLALWSYLNARIALLVALLTNLVIFWVSLNMPHRVPPWAKATIVSFVDHSPHECVVLSALPLAFGAYILTLATAHHLSRRGECAFLDIACVSQSDLTKQAKGISALGAVLARSETCVLLVDEHYWKRLWCIFEVAAFCRHADASRLIILPLHNSMLDLGYALFFMVLSTAATLLGTSSFNQARLISHNLPQPPIISHNLPQSPTLAHSPSRPPPP